MPSKGAYLASLRCVFGFLVCQGIKLWIDLAQQATYPQAVNVFKSYPVSGYTTEARSPTWVKSL
jgi:hypothetical protein